VLIRVNEVNPFPFVFKNMKTDVLLSGAGGQGLMSLAKILAQAALFEGKFSSYIPSYGAEVRGGTAYCFVKISDKPIASPLVEIPDVAIILNQLSFDKFGKVISKCPVLILNSDLITTPASSKNKNAIILPLNRIALSCGNIKSVNIVSLGVFTSVKPDILKEASTIQTLNKIFTDKTILEQNIKAFYAGKGYLRFLNVA
jgi:2-oxoglutarate ferredoxin oxidoreductase subunit gamma